MRLAAAEKGLAAVWAAQIIWPNETMWHVTAATEAA